MVEGFAMRLEVTVNVRPLKPGRTADPLRPELSGPKATSEYEPVKRSELDRGLRPAQLMTSITVEGLAMRLEVTVNVRPLKPGRTADPFRPELPGLKVTSRCEPVK